MDARAQPSEFLRARAVALGPVGELWLAELAGTIAALEQRWQLVVGAPLDGGTAAHVLSAERSSGESVVLKLGLPTPGFASEMAALEQFAGEGYVRVLESDSGRSAMLLERLGGSLGIADLPPETKLELLGGLIRQSWRSPTNDASLAPFDKAAALAGDVRTFRSTLDHGCPDAVFAAAAECAARRSAAFGAVSPVVVHGDAAAANVLRVTTARPGAELGWVFVDPEPFVGDPAYDLGVAGRDWCDELLAASDAADLMRHYCDVLAQASGTTPDEIWDWAFLERVSTGLYVLSFGAPEYARRFFESAARILS